jgi:diketogulonate reductase-like aldo/keto reductase
MPRVALADGTTLPTVGLGLYYTPPGAAAYEIVSEALGLGYRHLDTAGFYGNEADVGRAVRDSGVPRSEIHITSKVWPEAGGPWLADGYATVLDAVRTSVRELGTHADLYLIHWPVNPSQRVSYWLALEEAQRLGLARSIGVSNYGVRHLRELLDSPRTSVVPAANEVELSPFLRKDDLEAFCRPRGIRLIAYSPLARAQRLDNPALAAVAARHSVAPAQVLVRWSVQHGYVPLPKSVRAERVAQNVDVFGFELSVEDMAQLDALDERLFTEWEEWGELDPTELP